MTTTTIDIRDLPTRLDEALRLVPVPEATGPRIPGLHPGAIEMAEDFDAPVPDDFLARPAMKLLLDAHAS